ncbi:hypothetical protein [Fodinibius salsisoli]|uniref:Uncharacterized protein n=1 Tax=Fodinibius salsisoli TaxID=2820877 RepID=A0ABT3PJV4_9BACT|nr:hypothetical protein [Fodinibius salsisoli]MCW9706222.1 hypothetical protein [Fodinibius salsisoli]
MNIRGTYWIASLSLLLSLSLALPYCCHADIPELFFHHQPSHASHSHQSDARQCNCGHELVKDFQKTKKVVSSPTLLLSSDVTLQDRIIFAVSIDFLSIPQIQPGILSDSGPPLHLLNSVFLN